MLKNPTFFCSVNYFNLKIETYSRNYDFETFPLPFRYHLVTVFEPIYKPLLIVTTPLPYRSGSSLTVTDLISRKVPYIETSHSSKLKYRNTLKLGAVPISERAL